MSEIIVVVVAIIAILAIIYFTRPQNKRYPHKTHSTHRSHSTSKPSNLYLSYRLISINESQNKIKGHRVYEMRYESKLWVKTLSFAMRDNVADPLGFPTPGELLYNPRKSHSKIKYGDCYLVISGENINDKKCKKSYWTKPKDKNREKGRKTAKVIVDGNEAIE